MKPWLRRVLATLALLAGTVAVAEEPLWVGTFAVRESSDRAVQAAIETAVEKMNFIARAVARSRLRKTNPVYQRIVIERTDELIAVQFDDRKPIEMPADGSRTRWTREDGEVFDVNAEALGGKLVQTFEAEDGRRVNTFSANEAGQLTMEVEVSSPQLPIPVFYTLLYERDPTP
ncbi:MAG TPA: hypothetical protein VK025_11335 [Steroidobacter sp.]|jgi:hypothetical protein|nr:hypothetical protein [Steroidobacteraceae bacterium]HLS81985.1 hypothetical protein [Steroidobacter sp.]